MIKIPKKEKLKWTLIIDHPCFEKYVVNNIAINDFEKKEKKFYELKLLDRYKVPVDIFEVSPATVSLRHDEELIEIHSYRNEGYYKKPLHYKHYEWKLNPLSENWLQTNYTYVKEEEEKEKDKKEEDYDKEKPKVYKKINLTVSYKNDKKIDINKDGRKTKLIFITSYKKNKKQRDIQRDITVYAGNISGNYININGLFETPYGGAPKGKITIRPYCNKKPIYSKLELVGEIGYFQFEIPSKYANKTIELKIESPQYYIQDPDVPGGDTKKMDLRYDKHIRIIMKPKCFQ